MPKIKFRSLPYNRFVKVLLENIKSHYTGVHIRYQYQAAEFLYGWYEPFVNVCRLCEEEILFGLSKKEYLNSLITDGMRIVDDKNVLHLLELQDMPNNSINRSKSDENLKKLIAGNILNEDIMAKTISHMIELFKNKKFISECYSACDGRTAYSSLEDIFFNVSEEFEKFVANNGTISTFSALLIYLQTLQLPENDSLYNSDFPDKKNNIYMSTKSEIEDLNPLDLIHDAIRILIVNYAGTTLLTGASVSEIYTKRNGVGAFITNLCTGNSKIDIVLTNPDSFAANDAVKYKMKPRTFRVDPEELIKINTQQLKRTKSLIGKKSGNLNLYYTDVALPCAYFMTEYTDNTRDNIKVDLYLPSFAGYDKTIDDDGNVLRTLTDDSVADDVLRQSFVVFRKDNRALYETFKKNAEDILKNSKRVTIEK